jgi:hypothetical protein
MIAPIAGIYDLQTHPFAQTLAHAESYQCLVLESASNISIYTNCASLSNLVLKE